MSKNLGKSKRGTPLEKEEKRPSVFERLGVRRDNSNPSSYSVTDIAHGGGSTRWPETVGDRSNSARDPRRQRGPPPGSHDIRSSASYSPPLLMGKSHGKDMKQGGLLSTPTKKNKDSSSKKFSRGGVDEKHGTKKDKKRTSGGSGKKGLEKKRRMARTSSASSGDSSDEDSNNSSSNNSRSSSSSSSSSSNDSSDSDSSVLSVKLNSEKTKPKKANKNKGDKKRPPVVCHSSRSSSSGLDSSSTPVKRGPIPIDLREKLNARSPSGLKDQYQKKTGDKRSMGYDKAASPGINDRYKKRPPQQDTFIQDDIKRRRVLSPSPVDKYRVLPPDEPPQHHRRAPQMQVPKHGRSPPVYHKDVHQHQQRSGNSPGRRLEMQRRPERPDPRNDRDRRSSPFPAKSDYDKRRDLPPEFGRDNRPPRERVAPTRTPMEIRQERERMDRPPDYQRRPQPQARSPYNQQDQARNFNYKGNMNPYDKDRQNQSQSQRFPNPQPQQHDEKRQTLIPKSKEALAERYEQMRKSGYVDKWVDETVKATQRGSEDAPSPLLSTPSSKSTLSPVGLKLDDIVKDLKSEQIIPPVVDDLSDFSDDADELLNIIPDSSVDAGITDSPADVEIANTPKSSVPASPRKEIASEKPSAESPAAVQVRSTVETGPSTFSQERSLAKTRLQTSLPSQSQTDDLLDRMDFEEISDEELGEVENKVHIVDALGVDWASLVCQEKKNEKQTPETQSKSTSARKRWRPINILSGRISKELAGESLYNRILELKRAEDAADAADNGGSNEHIQKATRSRDAGVLEKIGLGPNSRALSSRRDMAVRRHLLDLPPKSLISLDLFHNNTTNTTTPEMDSIGELYKISIALFKSNISPAVALT